MGKMKIYDIERWFGIKYHAGLVGRDRLDLWNSHDNTSDLRLPKANPCIQSKFNVLGNLLTNGEACSKTPELIQKMNSSSYTTNKM